MTPQRKLGSYHPGTMPGVSLCDTCTEDCKCDGEKVKCPDYIQQRTGGEPR